MTPRSGIPTRLRLSALGTAVVLATAGCSKSTDEQTQPSAPSGSNATASQPGPVTIMGAGDIAGLQDAAAATAQLIVAADPDAVITTGDNAYPDGSTSDYAEKFDPTWGPLKDRTHPVPGNHDYHTADAAGYVGYFGAANVTNQDDGGLYYAWDIGNGWRAYALNSEISTTGAQLEWLRADVAAHPGQRYILYAHRPRYTSSSNHGPFERLCPLWDVLAATGGLEISYAWEFIASGMADDGNDTVQVQNAGQILDKGSADV